MWQGKDAVEIGNGEHFIFSFLKPSLSRYLLTFGAVTIPAGVVQNTLSSAVVTTIEMAS
jgi:hypothetical protein